LPLFRMLVVAAALAAFTLTASAGAVTPPKLVGAVGPGFTITMKRFNKPLRLLKPGRYSITVSDRSNIHNFHLKGPGVNREITTIGFVGTKTAIVKLVKGTYTYICDPHFSTMKGTFKVV
jgi:Copper binding proteins, plastocyanin/azurin family